MDRPQFARVREYGARLGDAAFWTPYVTAALARHGLPVETIAPPAGGAVGTYPTFLAGRYVVKLFGARFSGGEGYAVERALHTLFREHPEVPAPRLVASGTLFAGPLEDGVPWSDLAPDTGADVEATWPWPYLITTLLGGVAWRGAPLDAGEQAIVARELGAAVRRVHALPLPSEAYWARPWSDRVAELRSGCVARHRRWGSLPPGLVEQIEPYLDESGAIDCGRPRGGQDGARGAASGPRPLVAPCDTGSTGSTTMGAAGAAAAISASAPDLPARCVVHADLHADHLFVATPGTPGVAGRASLVGIIDWGDAMAADPYYELPALQLGTFAGDARLLRAFLEGYGWPVGSDFARRAMAMTLLHEFDVLDDVRALIARQAPRSLDEVAALLWTV